MGNGKDAEITDIFMGQVGLIRDYWELHLLGLHSDDLIGTFFPPQLPLLKAYCRKHSAYHIVTLISPHHIVNRVEEHGFSYQLADGNQDPQLELKYPQDFIDKAQSFLHHIARCY